MARATSTFQSVDYGQPETGEWQELRGELEALLDHVESQVARTARPAPDLESLAERMRDLRHQVTENGTDTRRHEALRSVQRAIDKFSDRDLPPPPSPRDTLESAIQQIRSRHFSQGAPQLRAVPPAPAPRFDDMAQSVHGISSRLEKLETELRGQAKGQTANVREIADQVSQLSQVVELLAGAVGETGQVKRLETHIAGLAKLITDGPKVDVAALNKRMDDVTSTVGRLADLQKQHAERVDAGVTARLDDVSATVGRLADLQVQFANRLEVPRETGLEDAMKAVEDGVRNIYDRVDGLERSMALPPAELDRISTELARIAQLAKSPAQPQGLIELIDALNERIADVEARDAQVGDLKLDMDALRATVASAMEPRFSRLETQIAGMSERLGQQGGIEPSIAQLEAQIRQLVARMDQTGEQLTGLARLYTAPTSVPDLDQLASMVAERSAQSTIGLSETGYAEIERRIGRLIEEAARDNQSVDNTALESTIREVNERLQRLEGSLTSRPADPIEDGFAEVFRAAAPVASAERSSPITFIDRPSEDDEDAMPVDPIFDAPLRDVPFAAPIAPEAIADVVETIGDIDDEPEELPVTTGLPPEPRSTLDLPDDEVFVARPIPPSEPFDAAPPPNRNTFIEAHRRAARQASAAGRSTPSSADASSLISRAFARLQTAQDAATPTPTEPVAEIKPESGVRPSALAIFASRLKSLRGKSVPAEPEPQRIHDIPVTGTLVDAEPAEDEAGDSSRSGVAGYLVRHRQPILLAASVVALACLTLNLINQRMSPRDEVPAQTQAQVVRPAADGTLAPVPMAEQGLPADSTAPRLMLDNISTGSIDSPAQQFVATTEPPPMPSAFEAATALASASPAANLVLPVPLESPVKFDAPPAEVGPAPLRGAAANGDARAQFEVAAIYTEGRAVSEDLEAAAMWYERAAGQGFAPAQYRLGNLYENGRGVAKDIEEARLWYQRAAEAGNRMAMHNLAALYAGGGLGEQQFDAAAKWFEEAANRGMKDSQFNLGMLYARGLGVKQDMASSYKWFSLAASRGDEDAAKARDDVAASLDAATVQKVNAEVAAFQPQGIDLAANFAPIGTWSPTFDPGETIATEKVVKGVQTALSRLGFDVGTPDGVAGQVTADAIRQFERATGMSESGAVNPRLLAVLGSQPV